MKGKELQVHEKVASMGKARVAEGQCEKGKCFGQKELQLGHWGMWENSSEFGWEWRKRGKRGKRGKRENGKGVGKKGKGKASLRQAEKNPSLFPQITSSLK